MSKIEAGPIPLADRPGHPSLPHQVIAMERPSLLPTLEQRPPLRIYRADDYRREPADDSPPDDSPTTFDINDFWAGRNRATRKSARAAA